MPTETNTRALTRLSLAAVILVVLAGLMVGSAFIGAQDEPIDNATPLDGATQLAIDKAVEKALADALPKAVEKALKDAEAGKPEPRRTAYVDFLSLLKDDKPLARKQVDVADEMRKTMDEIDSRWEVKILAQKRIRDQNLPHTKAYRDAMHAQLEAEMERYQEKLYAEQLFQEDVRKFGITRFKELRNLTRDLAKKSGYNEVLNIVRDIDKLGGNQDDFQALQQQLLVSPVLYYEVDHDITDQVKVAAKAIWDETITFEAHDKVTGIGGIVLNLDGEAAPLKRNAADEIEVKLGQKGSFVILVQDKGVPAVGPRAATRWFKRGLGVGELSEDGKYTAPEAFPVGGDTFDVTVRSAIDPTVEQTVTIRLLDKDGKRMPAK
jgi:hypothetical protein